MVPRMSVVRRPSQGSPVSFKRRPRKKAAPSSEPCRICSARKATRLLPTPTRHRASRQKPLINYGGTLGALRPLLNAGDDSQWCLMVAWLVGAFLPQGAFSRLVLNGEQGSAKSSTSLVLLSMLDPSDAGLSAPPKDETDATVSADR